MFNIVKAPASGAMKPEIKFSQCTELPTATVSLPWGNLPTPLRSPVMIYGSQQLDHDTRSLHDKATIALRVRQRVRFQLWLRTNKALHWISSTPTPAGQLPSRHPRTQCPQSPDVAPGAALHLDPRVPTRMMFGDRPFALTLHAQAAKSLPSFKNACKTLFSRHD